MSVRIRGNRIADSGQVVLARVSVIGELVASRVHGARMFGNVEGFNARNEMGSVIH